MRIYSLAFAHAKSCPPCRAESAVPTAALAWLEEGSYLQTGHGGWPLHNIAITNMVWFLAYERRVRVNPRLVHKSVEVNKYLVKANTGASASTRSISNTNNEQPPIPGPAPPAGTSRPSPLGLYTILPSPIVYGVWHTEGGVGGGAYIVRRSCNSIAIG